MWSKTHLSAVEGDRKDKHRSHDDGDDVEGDHGVRPLVPAGEHGGVAELHQEDVDDPHGAQQQGLYCDWKTEEYRGGQIAVIERGQVRSYCDGD